MTSKDDQFLLKLLQTFRIEAEEHLKALSDGLLALEKCDDADERKKIIETIFREAHSLKGAARSVNMTTIQDICQSLENVLAALKQSQIQSSQHLFDTLHKTIDSVSQALTSEPDKEAIICLVNELQELSKGSEVTQKTNTVFQQAQSSIELPKTVHSEHDKTIRVSLQKMNKLFQQAEEMLISKLISQQHASSLRKLQHDVCEKNNAKLREHIDHLVKESDQNAHFVGSLVDALLEDMKKVLMQPMSTLFDQMPRMIRDLAQSLKKEVNTEFSGGEIEVDRRILEEIKDPLIHLIRNCIDHGIESSEQRVKNNKQAVGLIKITATQISGNVIITVSDDGKGVDQEKLKKSAIQQKIISASEADRLADDETLQLIFHSGISTAPIITELSGRGLGMGIVSEKADRLGGKVSVSSTKDLGTQVTLTLPLTLATFRGIHIKVSDRDFIMPTHNVQRVIKIEKDSIKNVENREVILVEHSPLSFTPLASLLDLHCSTPPTFALIVNAAEKTMAFGIDKVFAEHEVLVKTLGKQCARIKNVMAATVMEGGEVLAILSPIDLVRSAMKGEILRAQKSEVSGEEEPSKKVVLVVEDSVTTRMLLKNILESVGYEVKMAVDGMEGFEMLQTNNIDLLLTDVEMPRMDGFSLVEKAKLMANHKELPIIICSARGSREDRERGIQLGASAYIDKSSFSQTGLLSIVRKLL